MCNISVLRIFLGVAFNRHYDYVFLIWNELIEIVSDKSKANKSRYFVHEFDDVAFEEELCGDIISLSYRYVRVKASAFKESFYRIYGTTCFWDIMTHQNPFEGNASDDDNPMPSHRHEFDDVASEEELCGDIISLSYRYVRVKASAFKESFYRIYGTTCFLVINYYLTSKHTAHRIGHVAIMTHQNPFEGNASDDDNPMPSHRHEFDDVASEEELCGDIISLSYRYVRVKASAFKESFYRIYGTTCFLVINYYLTSKHTAHRIGHVHEFDDVAFEEELCGDIISLSYRYVRVKASAFKESFYRIYGTTCFWDIMTHQNPFEGNASDDDNPMPSHRHEFDDVASEEELCGDIISLSYRYVRVKASAFKESFYRIYGTTCFLVINYYLTSKHTAHRIGHVHEFDDVAFEEELCGDIISLSYRYVRVKASAFKESFYRIYGTTCFWDIMTHQNPFEGNASDDDNPMPSHRHEFDDVASEEELCGDIISLSYRYVRVKASAFKESFYRIYGTTCFLVINYYLTSKHTAHRIGHVHEFDDVAFEEELCGDIISLSYRYVRVKASAFKESFYRIYGTTCFWDIMTHQNPFEGNASDDDNPMPSHRHEFDDVASEEELCGDIISLSYRYVRVKASAFKESFYRIYGTTCFLVINYYLTSKHTAHRIGHVHEFDDVAFEEELCGDIISLSYRYVRVKASAFKESFYRIYGTTCFWDIMTHQNPFEGNASDDDNPMPSHRHEFDDVASEEELCGDIISLSYRYVRVKASAFKESFYRIYANSFPGMHEFDDVASEEELCGDIISLSYRDVWVKASAFKESFYRIYANSFPGMHEFDDVASEEELCGDIISLSYRDVWVKASAFKESFYRIYGTTCFW
ncbi:hypothetical protein L6452_15422 [Arctium lappa]|uniref:Uncharacterized protein n=1 Tax=Arctium lappa TaxID=4217 RepID=A0ACB9CNJ4_ARCLA|nr:hypothetical protein L6452_15422 [Arctium lappa]